MKIGQKIGKRSVEIIKSTEFTEYLAEKVHQTNDPDETFAQKLSSALITMGIVKPDEQPLSYEEWYNFTRGGAEVYVAAAQVIFEKKGKIEARPFVSKAIIAGNESMKQMLERRTMLASFNILVPELYSAINACICEQFIPFAINNDAVLNGHITLQVLDDITYAATVLDIRGFPDFNFINDMRTDGKHAYYVDFGWDLWNPGKHPVDNAYRTLIKFVEQYLHYLKDTVVQNYQQNFQNLSTQSP